MAIESAKVRFRVYVSVNNNRPFSFTFEKPKCMEVNGKEPFSLVTALRSHDDLSIKVNM